MQTREERLAVKRECARRFRAANRELMRERDRQWRLANIEQVREAGRRYQQEHREERKAYLAAWHASNYSLRREQELARQAAYRDAHREELAERRARPEAREKLRSYVADHAEYFRDAARKRRALKAGVDAEQIERAVVWERDSGICAICAAPADPASWHLDHVVPLSAGGPHVYANVAVTHPSCNLRKHDADPRVDPEWTYLLTNKRWVAV